MESPSHVRPGILHLPCIQYPRCIYCRNTGIKRRTHLRVRILRIYSYSDATYSVSIAFPDANAHSFNPPQCALPHAVHLNRHTLHSLQQYQTRKMHPRYPHLYPPVIPISGSCTTTLTRLILLLVLISLNPIDIARSPSPRPWASALIRFYYVYPWQPSASKFSRTLPSYLRAETIENTVYAWTPRFPYITGSPITQYSPSSSGLLPSALISSQSRLIRSNPSIHPFPYPPCSTSMVRPTSSLAHNFITDYYCCS